MKIKWLVLILFSFTSISLAQKSAITFDGGDRLGDKLFTYCRAKWLAHTHNLTFLCPYFEYKNALHIHTYDQSLSDATRKGYSTTVRIKKESEIIPGRQDVLYIMDFYMQLDISKSVFDHAITIHFKNDPLFIQDLHTCIAPIAPLDMISIPTDMPTIALHVRRGGGFDNVKTCYKRWPTKFPPDDFYIDQIKRIASLYNPGQPLYIYLFTDDQHPERIVAHYKKVLNMPQITFEHRVHRHYKEHVLDDMFAMTQFDYLIRSNSQYTFFSMILGDHSMVISPSKGSWHQDHAVIDQIWIVEKSRNNTYTQTYRETH